MTTVIQWSDIEAECGNFRAGFVATFRKYEGQPTDEKTVQGRIIKVTAASFARHMGIPERTFRVWLAAAKLAVTPEKRLQMNTAAIRRAARQDPSAFVDVLSELPDEHQRDIVRELHQKQLERAGADFSTKGRKEREARTAEHFAPLRESLNAMQVVSLAERLADKLRHLPADLTEEDRREIDAAIDDVILARTEMHMQVGS